MMMNEPGTTEPLHIVNAKTRHAYNLAAERYHALFHDELQKKPYDRALLDRFAGHYSKDSLICDAGCGPSAHIGRYLFDKGIPVLGVDISDRCVELACRHNPDMRFQQADMGNLPVAEGTFDGIIACYSILDTPRRYVAGLFREFHRVLKAGGRLLVAVKAGDTEGYLSSLVGIPTEVYFTLFTQEEIRQYFEQAGFVIESLEQRHPYPDEIEAERIFAVGRKHSAR